ncbi:MAG: hypothetical protein FWE12_01365 [Oscillospiraceae bacterium]|nr:hypothetical protein [Oscillospiraceae bacterium]
MKPLVSGALLKEQFRRFWPILFLTALGYGLFLILPIYVHSGGRDLYRSAEVMLDILSMRRPFLLFATAALPFGIAMLLFSPLFDRRAAEGFYRLTDTKGQLFWSNALTGLLLILIPLLLLSALMLIPVRFPGVIAGYEPLTYPTDLFSRALTRDSVINTIPVVAAFFLRAAVSMLFYFALFLLAVSVAGSGWIAALLCLILPFVPMLLSRFGTLVASVYVFGFDSSGIPPIAEVLDYANPLTWLVQTILGGLAYVFGVAGVPAPAPDPILSFTNPLTWGWNWGAESQALYFGVYAVSTVVLFGLACFAFTLRKAERAGELVAFRPLRYILIFLLSVAGMVAMGRYFQTLVSGRWFLYYGFALGFVLLFLIAQMVFERSFRIRHTLKWLMPMAGIAGALYGLMLLATLFGARFYTQYVPEEARVSGVFISSEARWETGDSFASDRETIRGVIALHAQITDTEDSRRADMRTAFWQSISGGGRQFADLGGEYFFLTYRLQNGDHIYRRYALPGDFIEALSPDLRALIGTGTEETPLPYPVFGNPDVVESVWLRFYLPGEDPFAVPVDDPAQIIALFNALRRDMTADSGEGEPMLVVRINVGEAYTEAYATPEFTLVYISHTMAWLMQQM